MTLVDAGTGEVVDFASLEEARRITNELRAAQGAIEDRAKVFVALAVDAFNRRVWVPMGYSSWEVYCAAEQVAIAERIPKTLRVEIVSTMTEAQMSTRAIAAPLGVDHTTVLLDQRQAGGGNPPPAADRSKEDVEPRFKELVKGRDGKAYKRPEPKPTPAPPKPSTEERHARIVGLALSGHSTAQIAAEVGITDSRVSHVLKQAGVKAVQVRAKNVTNDQLVRNGVEQLVLVVEVLAEMDASSVGQDPVTVEQLNHCMKKLRDFTRRVRDGHR